MEGLLRCSTIFTNKKMKQITNTILMIEPVSFRYNDQKNTCK